MFSIQKNNNNAVLAKISLDESPLLRYNFNIKQHLRSELNTMPYESLECAIDAAARALITALREKKMTFATAESCTAGMIAARMGDYAGVSDVLLGGVVSYANEVKTNVLGVPEEVLSTVGAVSEECARYMADGARRVTGADVAVSVTGIAGPGGAVPGKPVGTVCFGVSTSSGTKTETVYFPETAERGEIRRMTVVHALELTRAEIE